MTHGAVIAAVYTVVTLVIAPIAYGPIQCRLSEALTILPVFSVPSIWGLTLGCALSNLAAVMSGNAIAGVWDILFGTLATLAAAVCTRMTRKITFKGFPVLATVFPVVFNALVIGAELTVVMIGRFELVPFLLNAASVGAGQILACMVAGLLLFKPFEKIFNSLEGKKARG